MEIRSKIRLPGKSWLLVLAILFTTCSDPVEKKMRTLNLAPFSTIKINSVFTVFLSRDSVYSVQIVGDENAIDNVDASVDNEVLSLSDNNKVKWVTPEKSRISIYVTAPDYHMIDAFSSYELNSTDTITGREFVIFHNPDVRISEIDIAISCENIWYWNNYRAGGKLNLRGKCENVEINNYALHSVDTRHLRAAKGIVNNYAKGDCEVFIEERLEFNLHGTGNIYLYGNPTEVILIDHTSTGRLIKMD